MNILYLLVPLALILAGAGVAAFFWSVRSGQFDDTDTPALRVLMEDDLPQVDVPGDRNNHTSTST